MENHGGIEGSSETYIVDMTTYRHIFGSDPLEFAEPPKISLGYLHVKRTLDVVVSLVAILMLFLPGLLIAAAVVATSKGPLFYRETGGQKWSHFSHLEISLHALRCVSTEPFGFRGACGADA